MKKNKLKVNTFLEQQEKHLTLEEIARINGIKFMESSDIICNMFSKNDSVIISVSNSCIPLSPNTEILGRPILFEEEGNILFYNSKLRDNITNLDAILEKISNLFDIYENSDISFDVDSMFVQSLSDKTGRLVLTNKSIKKGLSPEEVLKFKNKYNEFIEKF